MIKTSLQIVCAAAIVGAVALADDAPAPSFVGKKAGQVRDDNSFKMKLVWCPPGMFTMGGPKEQKDRNNDEVPVQVTLTKGFWMGQHEVTEYEWQFVMETTPWKDNGHSLGDDSPATYIRWGDATAFCEKLTRQERQLRHIPATWAYTLPTEAQWEYACRAGTTTRFSFGNDDTQLGDYAWFLENAEQSVHQVGLKKANPWGLHDMHGNVCEWTRDWYSPKACRRNKSGDYRTTFVRGAGGARRRLGLRSPEQSVGAATQLRARCPEHSSWLSYHLRAVG